MSAILNRLRLVSHAPTPTYNGAGGHSSEHPGGKQPSGEGRPPHERWATLYEAAPGDEEREHCIDGAGRELRSIVQAPDPSTYTVHEETAAEFDARVRQKIQQKWTVDEVALDMKCTPTRVKQAIASAPPGENLEYDETKIRELHAQGVPIRNIAVHQNVSKSTVHRVLKRAA